MRRWIAVAAAPGLLFAGAAALAAPHAKAPAQAGGLSITPAVLEESPAHAGTLGSVMVTNRSKQALTVTVAPRQWNQDASGKVSAKRAGGLAGVSVDKSSFTLAPQGSQNVTVSASSPAAGYEYGALEVIGIPADAAKRSGVVVGYRLVGTLRMLPAQKRYSLTAGDVKRDGKAVVVPVTNDGNTLDPVSGTVQVKGARGTLNDNVGDVKILPRKKVDVVLAPSLRAGSYSATLTLKQAGNKLLTVKRKFVVR
jgi:hypothetical protein